MNIEQKVRLLFKNSSKCTFESGMLGGIYLPENFAHSVPIFVQRVMLNNNNKLVAKVRELYSNIPGKKLAGE